jgi:hypothetical protein
MAFQGFIGRLHRPIRGRWLGLAAWACQGDGQSAK